MDTSDSWIQQRTGIQARHWVKAPETTSDLAVSACRASLGQLNGKSVDAIVAATLSPDFTFPGIGVLIQRKLGLPEIPAYDVRNQCAGFLYALEMADALVARGRYRRVLVVGAEVHSTGLDLTTRGRDLAVLFGDGAGSCVVEAISEPGSGEALEVLGTELHADGTHVEELWCQLPGSAHFPRVDAAMIERGAVYPSMNGKRVFEHAVRRMGEVSVALLGRLGFTARDVALLVPHQANLRINTMVAEQLGVPAEKVFNTIQQYGNTTAATIPIGLHDAYRAGRITPGDIVLSAAFGSGFVWGAAVLRAVG
jgi:3-oxoacyl-[acyl-carrier-protein] synthase-3